jgi:hypothetical protein
METTEEHLISVRVHETEKGDVVGACDNDLIGKTLVEEDVKIELAKEFFADKKMPIGELLALLEDCLTANLVGERVVEAYCKENPEHADSVKRVDGVPHVQLFRL